MIIWTGSNLDELTGTQMQMQAHAFSGTHTHEDTSFNCYIVHGQKLNKIAAGVHAYFKMPAHVGYLLKDYVV